MNSIKEDVTLKTGADFLAEGWQHVAYYDDGEFHWMSGHSPRNCELYTPVQSTSDLRAKAEGLVEALREMVAIQDIMESEGSCDGSFIDPRVDAARQALTKWDQSQ